MPLVSSCSFRRLSSFGGLHRREGLSCKFDYLLFIPRDNSPLLSSAPPLVYAPFVRLFRARLTLSPKAPFHSQIANFHRSKAHSLISPRFVLFIFIFFPTYPFCMLFLSRAAYSYLAQKLKRNATLPPISERQGRVARRRSLRVWAEGGAAGKAKPNGRQPYHHHSHRCCPFWCFFLRPAAFELSCRCCYPQTTRRPFAGWAPWQRHQRDCGRRKTPASPSSATHRSSRGPYFCRDGGVRRAVQPSVPLSLLFPIAGPTSRRGWCAHQRAQPHSGGCGGQGRKGGRAEWWGLCA